MIELTDEMERLMYEALAAAEPGRHHAAVREGLAAVLALAERQWQEAWGDAFQAGWWRGQHRLCPRCGVELEREVAAERAGQPDPEPPPAGG